MIMSEVFVKALIIIVVIVIFAPKIYREWKNRPYNQVIDAFAKLITSGQIVTAYAVNNLGEAKPNYYGVYGPYLDEEPVWGVSNKPDLVVDSEKTPTFLEKNKFLHKGKEYDLYELISNTSKRYQNGREFYVEIKGTYADGGVDCFIQNKKDNKMKFISFKVII